MTDQTSGINETNIVRKINYGGQVTSSEDKWVLREELHACQQQSSKKQGREKQNRFIA